jgi:photosystem II stability/assembly factor-like uncharacterized protein
MRRPAFAVLVTAVLTGIVAAAAAAARWMPSHGPDGGGASALAIAPTAPETVYVGTGGGVFRSLNGGLSWASAGLAGQPGPDGSSPPAITSLVVDPRTPTTLYAGLSGRWDGGATYRRPVFKSTDGGHSWRALALRGQPLAITPTGPPILYAAAAGSRLFRSTDAGRSWQSADRGLPPAYLWSLAFDPTAPATLYAAMGADGVFESRDGGASWRALGIAPADGDVTAIAVDPRQPHTIYAGADAGLLKSLDGGGSWRRVNAALGGHGRDRGYMQVTALVVNPRDSLTVYATTRCTGVFKSDDGGHTWSPANAGLQPRCPSTYSLALDPRAPSTLYAADPSRGVFESRDGGSRWYAMNDGLSLSTVFALAVDPQQPHTVYAAAGDLGLFDTDDGGAEWRSLAPRIKLVDDVALDPTSPVNVLAVVPRYGVVRSTDAGRTWVQARLGTGERGVSVVAISGGAAYAGGRSLFASTNDGRSWRALRPSGIGIVQALAIAPENASVVYAGTFGLDSGGHGSTDGGLYRSIDGGNSWQRLTGALDTDVAAIALDPENPAAVYIATFGGKDAVFKSADGGTSWQRADSGLPRRRVRFRTDNGRKWTTYMLGVNALAIDPAHPTALYAAIYGRGVFRSTDSGKNWQPFNAGLTLTNVRALALDATGQTLYAGTDDGGVVSLRTKR